MVHESISCISLLVPDVLLRKKRRGKHALAMYRWGRSLNEMKEMQCIRFAWLKVHARAGRHHRREMLVFEDIAQLIRILRLRRIVQVISESRERVQMGDRERRTTARLCEATCRTPHQRHDVMKRLASVGVRAVSPFVRWCSSVCCGYVYAEG